MKEKIQTYFVRFFVVMFLCTIISHDIAEALMPKVSTVSFKKGSLIYSFQGNGTMTACDRSFQCFPEGQKVKSILVNLGTAVEKDEPLVLLDLDFLNEQKKEVQREIEKLQLALKQQQLEAGANARVSATVPAELAMRETAKQLSKAKEAYEQAAEEEKEAAEAAVNAAEDAFRQAEHQMELAVQEEAAMLENEAVREEASALAQKSTFLEIEALQGREKKLRALLAEEGMIRAQTEGTLASIGASEGMITSGTEVIAIETGGTEACGILPPENIGALQVGDEVQILTAGSAREMDVRIERLERDALGNTVWYGKTEEATYQIGTGFSYEYRKSSEMVYEKLIPLEAIHEEHGETYVLTAQIRSGVLKDGYTAVKTAVNLIRKDAQNAAVQTTLPEEALIIAYADKEVRAGDRVRLETQ